MATPVIIADETTAECLAEPRRARGSSRAPASFSPTTNRLVAGRLKRWIQALVVLLLAGTPASAQHYLEFRGADTRYRFADWSFSFKNSAVVDVFYVGVPGSNEFNLGLGYAIRKGQLSVTPLAYAVLGKEGGQRGVKLALLVSFGKDGWKLNGFLGHYAPLSGEVPQYQVLDTLDFTRSFAQSWEAGVSSGFFHTDQSWSPQIGPVLKRNDRLGSWAISWRFGPQREIRAVRVLAF